MALVLKTLDERFMHATLFTIHTHHADLLAHRQSENPMAQTSDNKPPQTSHADLEQTASERLQKLPTQLNTPNIFVPDLVQVSPNASDIQWLGRCVPAYRCD